MGQVMGTAHLSCLEEVLIQRDDRRRHGLLAALSYCATPALLFGVIGLLAGGDPIILGVLAAVLVIAGPLVYLLATRGRESFVLVVAGPRTLGIGTWGQVDEDGRHVDVPTLTAFRLVDRPGGGPVLRLSQYVGAPRLDAPMGALEANPELWDLVHLGLQHAAVAGAEVDDHTRSRLRLPWASVRPSTVDDTRST